MSQIAFHPAHPYLAVQSHDRSVEIFRIRSEEEARKKQVRRKKRAKEKKLAAQSKSKTEISETDFGSAAEEQGGSDEIKPVDLFTPHIVVHASGKIRSFDFGSGAVTKGGFQV